MKCTAWQLCSGKTLGARYAIIVVCLKETEEMARTVATEKAKATRGGVAKQVAPRSDGVGKRHRKPKQATVTQPPKKRCQQPCCWKSALGVRCACPGKKGKGRCAKTPKQAAKRARKGGLEDALGLRDALYPGQTVRDGARAQYEARYGTLRRAGQGVRQQPTFVELPPRQRQRPKRLGF